MILFVYIIAILHETVRSRNRPRSLKRLTRHYRYVERETEYGIPRHGGPVMARDSLRMPIAHVDATDDRWTISSPSRYVFQA